MNTMKLYEISEQHAGLLALDDPELPQEAIDNTLEALQGEFEDKGRSVIAFALNCDAQAKVIDEHIKRLQARSKALKRRHQSMRDYLLTNMERCGISKIESPLFTATVKSGGSKSVTVDADAELDKKFQRVTVTADKAAIKKALEAGEEVNGAHIETKNTLMIK